MWVPSALCASNFTLGNQRSLQQKPSFNHDANFRLGAEEGGGAPSLALVNQRLLQIWISAITRTYKVWGKEEWIIYQSISTLALIIHITAVRYSESFHVYITGWEARLWHSTLDSLSLDGCAGASLPALLSLSIRKTRNCWRGEMVFVGILQICGTLCSCEEVHPLISILFILNGFQSTKHIKMRFRSPIKLNFKLPLEKSKDSKHAFSRRLDQKGLLSPF